MKVSKNWLKKLIDLPPQDELILLLNDKTIGTKEVTDTFIELDMKGYNRADLLSLRGVAFEVSALTGNKIKVTEVRETDFFWVEANLPKLDVIVEEEADTPLYCLVKIENLKVAPSDRETIEKLTASGIRAVNNIADITNLIMLEFGQPLHAFDAEKVKNQNIIVRRAKDQELIVTLDSKKRQLTQADLVIADQEKPIGIAGVMGGENSEITNQTTTVLLEAAIFNPTLLRKTATRLGLTSEASKRFYHGLTRKRLLQALNQAILMYQNLGGKPTAMVIRGDTKDQKRTIPLRLERVNLIIGEQISPDLVENYLSKLNFVIEDKLYTDDKISYVVTPPYYRLDLEVEADVIEEIARLYGYEKIKTQPIPKTKILAVNQKSEIIRQFKTSLSELGFWEVFTYPYYSTQILQALGFDNKLESLVKIANPISKETEYLRQELWPNLLEAAATNYKKGYKKLSIFEIGKIYSVTDARKLQEQYHLAICLIDGTDQPINKAYTKFKQFLADNKLNYAITEDNTQGLKQMLFHLKRFLSVTKDQEKVGILSEIHPRITDRFDLNARIAVLELDLSLLFETDGHRAETTDKY